MARITHEDIDIVYQKLHGVGGFVEAYVTGTKDKDTRVLVSKERIKGEPTHKDSVVKVEDGYVMTLYEGDFTEPTLRGNNTENKISLYRGFNTELNRLVNEFYKKEEYDIINLTPHKLDIKNKNGQVVEIGGSGTIARVQVRYEPVGEVNGFYIHKAKYGRVEGLPDPKEGVLYVVSRMVAQAVPERKDLLIPGELLRDRDGVVIGANGFSVI